VYKEYVNVGIAVDTDRGLVVPVLRDADRKSDQKERPVNLQQIEYGAERHRNLSRGSRLNTGIVTRTASRAPQFTVKAARCPRN
jgi:pyruvate/2-oxoglutarate dehydrogenase complex dihydrolipoamide acyltransferase (E2) component